MARRSRLERSVDAWERKFEFDPPSETEAHQELRIFYYSALEVLSHMGPGIEAYRRTM